MVRGHCAARDVFPGFLQPRIGQSRFHRGIAAALAIAAALSVPSGASADEGGVSFWVPGFYGSLAATPQQLGWSIAAVYYHANVSASGNAAISRAITIGQVNPKINININANIHGQGDIGFLSATYVFATPFLGGQASASLLGAYGRNQAALNATISATPIPITKTIALEQSDIAFGDLVPQFSVRWNAGVNNYMTYITGDIPVGKYDKSDLANLGIGHGALDGGVGYTYFDEKTGHEFSAVAGLTGNFENQSTGYTNGLDFHLDWGASQFLSKQVQVGLVGYFYNQLTPDRGCAPQLCPFESRVIGIGPQLGYLFPVGNMQGYFNIKGYGEFDNNARPDGWNLWLTFALSPAAPSGQSSPPPILTKAASR